MPPPWKDRTSPQFTDLFYSRVHPCAGRIKRCCCCVLGWRVGLVLIALAMILYGIISYILFALFIFLKHPSAIYLFIEFPAHALVAAVECCLAVFLGILLFVGYIAKSPRIILLFSWLVMFGYALAIWFLVVILYEGVYVVDALIYAYFGKEYIRDGDNESMEHIVCETLYYTFMIIHVVLLTFLTTYVAMYTLTLYDQMVAENEEN